MAKNLFTQNPYTVTGIKPGQWFLDSSEDYATLISPGYLSSVATAGIEIQPNDFIFAQYNNGANVAIFVAIEASPGILSLEVYNPNSNSFIFQRVQFVAKGGSDLNPGTSIGLPKLTIQAAINALMMTSLTDGMVWVLDDNEYTENLVLPFNIQLYAPNAKLICNTGDLLTVNDSGENTVATVTVQSLTSNGGLAVNLLGSSSNMFLNAKIVQGDMYIEGGMIDCNIAQVASTVNVAATGQFGACIINTIFMDLIVAPGGTVVGSLGNIPGGGDTPTIEQYGINKFKDQLIYQTVPVTETAGRSVTADDSNTRIVYNNAAADEFELPATADADIPLGTNIEFMQLGLGAVQFIAGAGVTIVSIDGSTVETTGAGAVAKAWKYTNTIWVVSGDIAAVGP